MPRVYRTRPRADRSQATRERITEAVRELLAEGTFHESTVEEVAVRAGVARATLYQHFRSRLELIEACGHFPWLEQPEKFYPLVIEFLDRVAQ